MPPPHRTRRTTKRTLDFMQYPYPETERVLTHLGTLPCVAEETKRCVARLLDYRAVRTRVRLPRRQSAAVLVPLFVGRSGDLYVLLSRRSDTLKAFSGDTALPGGKVDPQDGTVEDTARREAFEEIGLPQDKARVPLLCVMEPHLAKGETVVTPVVVLILDNSLQPNLNSSEVTSIFAQPLMSFLLSTPHLSASRTTDPNNPYHTFTDLAWGDGGAFRLHRFLTGREEEGIKPVFGLTAAILIKTAMIGYERQPDFEVQPPNAPTPRQQITRALLDPANPLHIACEQEDIDANKAAAMLLRTPIEREKIRMRCTKRADGDDAVTTVDAAVGEEKGSCPWSRPGGDPGPQKSINDVERRVQGRVDEGNGEAPGAENDALKMQPPENKEQSQDIGEERGERGVVPDKAQHGEMLDEIRGAVNPDHAVRIAKIPKVGQEGSKDIINAGKGGIEKDILGDGERRDQGTERGGEGASVWRRLGETRKSLGKKGDGYNPGLVTSKKPGAKL